MTVASTETSPTAPGLTAVEAAAEECQRALASDPENPALLHRMGTLMGRLGQLDLRLALIGQAAARDPGNAGFQADLGLALADARESDAAVECFAEALRLDPGQPDALTGLAEQALDRADPVGAREYLARRRGDGQRTARVLGRLAALDERWSDAVDRYLEHLAGSPTDAAALFYLGVALQAQDLLEPAAVAYGQAVRFDPDLFEAHTNLATALTALGRGDDAVIAADRAVALKPERPGAYLNRANARREQGDWNGAASDLGRALGLAPDYAEAWSTLGNLLHDSGEMAQALLAHARAVGADPDLAQARWNRSFTLLATGQLAEGWDEYEWRRLTAAARPEPRDFGWPTWAGEPVAGRSILVWREQGLGDELLFLTCLPDLVSRGAAVTVLVSPRLVSLVARAFPTVTVLADGPAALPAEARFDCQIGLASLPRWLRRDRGAFPARGDFLVPDPNARARWADRLAALPPGPRIGLCWRSGLVTPERRRHYAPLGAFRALLATPGVVWVNLQYDDCREELAAIEREWGITIHRWDGEDLKNDLESVVGLLAGLDAVVTAPTAVSSLAGAVGRPTWQLDSGSDWTVFGEARSPWFPTVAVAARRPDETDWTSALDRIRDGLAGLKLSGGGAEN